MAELTICKYCGNIIPMITVVGQISDPELPTCCQCQYASERCTNIIKSSTIPDYICGRINCHKKGSGRFNKHISACYPRDCKSFVSKGVNDEEDTINVM